MNRKTKNKTTTIRLVVSVFFVLLQLTHISVANATSITVLEMISLTNSSRIAEGLPVLLISEKLSKAAEEKASDMFANQYFEHNSPQGKTPWDFIKAAGFEYKYAGENLAMDFVSASSAHQALMESSLHRANIISFNYREIGIAVREGIFEGNKSIIIVEEFGTPLEKQKIVQTKSRPIIEETIAQKAEEINKKIIEDLENSKSEESKIADNNISNNVEEGEVLNGIIENEQIIEDLKKTESVLSDERTQDSFQKTKLESLVFANYQNFWKSGSKIKEDNSSEILADNIFSEKLVLQSVRDSKLFRPRGQRIEESKSFKNYVDNSLLMILALSYAALNVFVVYKLFFVLLI